LSKFNVPRGDCHWLPGPRGARDKPAGISSTRHPGSPPRIPQPGGVSHRYAGECGAIGSANRYRCPTSPEHPEEPSSGQPRCSIAASPTAGWPIARPHWKGACAKGPGTKKCEDAEAAPNRRINLGLRGSHAWCGPACLGAIRLRAERPMPESSVAIASSLEEGGMMIRSSATIAPVEPSS